MKVIVRQTYKGTTTDVEYTIKQEFSVYDDEGEVYYVATSKKEAIEYLQHKGKFIAVSDD